MSEPDESETRSRAATTRWSRVILAGLLLAGLGQAVWLRWVCDDAFISFRYARNLVVDVPEPCSADDRAELTCPDGGHRLQPRTVHPFAASSGRSFSR